LGVAGREARVGAIAVQARMARAQRDRLVEIRERAGEVALLTERDPAIIERVDLVRIDLQRLVEVGDGAVIVEPRRGPDSALRL
jgi:hypothetical protein